MRLISWLPQGVLDWMVRRFPPHPETFEGFWFDANYRHWCRVDAKAERQRIDSLAWLRQRHDELLEEARSLRRAGEGAANSDSDLFGTATHAGWAAQGRYNDQAARATQEAREISRRIEELSNQGEG